MSTVADVIRAAESQLGYHEGPNNDNRYGVWWGLNNQPWCDLFTTWVFHTAGCPRPSEQVPGREGGASVNYTVQYWRSKGLFRPSTEAQPGDLIAYDWTGAEDGHDWEQTHIGVITGPGQTIEGNRGDMVARHTFTPGERLVWGTCNMQALIASGRGPSPAPAPLPRPVPTPGVPPYLMALVLTSPLMHNNHVLQWQQQMARRGWRIATDGIYGPASMATCRAFQIEKHLLVDGIVGPRTWVATWLAPVT